MALVASGTDISTVALQAINYLTSTQLPNGSWNDDPYLTALALKLPAYILCIFSITCENFLLDKDFVLWYPRGHIKLVFQNKSFFGSYLPV